MRKKILASILIMIIVFVGINMILINSSVLADSHRFDYNGELNEGKYPGFKAKLDAVKRERPGWKIRIMETGLDWNEVIRREGDGVGRSPRSLVQGKYGEWIVSNQTYDNGSWRAASDKAISYVMDPRNWLNPNNSSILQFMQLSYFEVSDENVKTALKDTFFDNMDNARIINNVSRDYNINVFFVVARIIQEQGYKGSATWKMDSDGKSYYNPFNINASGNGVSEIIKNALQRAKDKGWDTFEKGLRGGIEKIGTDYINEKQDTLYLQKFDVESKGTLYSHQYMQNIDAPRTEASILKSKMDKINGVLDNNVVLLIPVYNNMPATPAAEPNGNIDIGPINIQLKNNHTDWNVRENASISSKSVAKVANSSTIVLSIMRTNDGWHRVVLVDGTFGYIKFENDVWEQVNDVKNTNEAMIVKGDDVALRAGPGTNEPVIMRLSKNSILTRVDNTGRYNINGYIWDRVELPNGKKGFVARNFLEDTKKANNIYRVKVNDYLIMRDAPNGQDIRHLGDGVLVTVLERANEKVNGYFRDKIITAEGAVGYVARDYLENVNGEEKEEPKNKPEPQPSVQPAPQPEKKPENVNVNSKLIDNKNEEKKIIRVSPEARADDLKKKYSNVKDISNNDLGTGTTVKIDNTEYKIIKIGDVNGDGETDEIDAILILRKSIDIIQFNNIQNEAADVDKDGSSDEIDALRILRYTIGLNEIKY
ncbi:MAG: SH3 domain-containing protein [Clostridiales bacterium]|nr:SH3 domain-containing protein [Clostridiales bacterium]